MSERAKVGSLEAIEAFRADLVVYIAQTRSALEEVSSEVMRTRLWLENDQRLFWEGEIRKRRRDMEEAQQALFSARLSQFSDGVSLEQLAVQRARRALNEADAKMRTVKRWDRDFEGTVQPLVKQMEKLHTMLSNDLIKAVAELNYVTGKIAEYVETRAPHETPRAGSSEPAPSGLSDSNPEGDQNKGGTS